MTALDDAAPAVHRTAAELQAGFANVLASPADNGVLEMIVRRPEIDGREVLEEGHLDLVEGLAGDNWSRKPTSSTPDHSPHPDKQVTLTNSRAVDLMAGDRSRWPLAGDQLYVDLDLSLANLPGGTRLQIGDAVLEMTDAPHRGCAKFRARFGADALRWANSETGRKHELRGRNARVVVSGTIRTGDTIVKMS
jgi:MOSC domain-containing protein YiiM